MSIYRAIKKTEGKFNLSYSNLDRVH